MIGFVRFGRTGQTALRACCLDAVSRGSTNPADRALSVGWPIVRRYVVPTVHQRTYARARGVGRCGAWSPRAKTRVLDRLGTVAIVPRLTRSQIHPRGGYPMGRCRSPMPGGAGHAAHDANSPPVPGRPGGYVLATRDTANVVKSIFRYRVGRRSARRQSLSATAAKRVRPEWNPRSNSPTVLAARSGLNTGWTSVHSRNTRSRSGRRIGKLLARPDRRMGMGCVSQVKREL